MKRRALLLGLLIAISSMVTGVKAETLSILEANEIANSFFANYLTENPSSRGVSQNLVYAWDSNALFDGHSALSITSAAPTFYVFSGTDAFVIISAKKGFRTVIGYSDEGGISDVNTLPDPMRAYLLGIDAELKCSRVNMTASNETLLASPSNVVKYIETANWGQNAPFNGQCVTSTGQTAKTGCIPTAFSIVMYHHKWPDEGSGNLYNCQTGELITDRTYSWDKMLMDYSSGYNSEQADAVAKIMSHLGHAYMVTYGTSATNGNTGGSTEKLAKYFGYKNIQASLGFQSSQADWVAKIKESLENNCPIPYESTNSGTGDSKHIFVLDGYTADDYFHFNWGWNGYQNGYFTLSAMLPGDGDNYSGLSNHKAFFNLSPDRAEREITASASPVYAGCVSIDGGEFDSSVRISKPEGATVTLSAKANSGYSFEKWTSNDAIVAMTKDVSVQVTGNDAANSYVAHFLAVGEKDVTIPISYNQDFGSVFFGGVMVSSSLTVKENQEVTLVAVADDGYVFGGWSVLNGDETRVVESDELTFVASDNMEINAEFSSSVAYYDVMHATGTKTDANGARSSTWTFNTSNEFPVALQLKSTSGTADVFALSNSYDRYYAYAYDGETNGYDAVTYTLSVPSGYVIAGYEMIYWVPSSHKGQVTISNAESVNTPQNTADQQLIAKGLNAQSTSFTLSASKVGQQYITVESFVVAIKSEREPESPVYTVTVTASNGGSATVSATEVQRGETVTLTAIANNGYEFENWSTGTTIVSTANPFVATITADTEFVANFKDISSSGIDGVISDDVEVYATDGGIIIKNYIGNAKIVNIAGQTIKELAVKGFTEVTISRGVYFVIAGSNVAKVIIK